MSDWKLHENAYQEWRDHAADDYIAAQRQAFLDGFETAASEAEEFRLLREWLEEQRDRAKQQYSETDRDMYHARYITFVNVLVKLSEIGCFPEENDYE